MIAAKIDLFCTCPLTVTKDAWCLDLYVLGSQYLSFWRHKIYSIQQLFGLVLDFVPIAYAAFLHSEQ